MLIPAGVVSGHWLPWVLSAPLIPLLLLLLRKTEFSAMTTSLALLCVSSLLTNTFLYLSPGATLPPSFMHVNFAAEFLFTGLLLKTCTTNQYLKHGITTSMLVFLGIYITYSILSPGDAGIGIVMSIGIIILFILSLLALASRIHLLEQHLIENPGFWFAAGIFFHFGILSLLVVSQNGKYPVGDNEKGQLSVFYGIIFFLEFMFFSAGLVLQKPLDSNMNSVKKPGTKPR